MKWEWFLNFRKTFAKPAQQVNKQIDYDTIIFTIT